MVAWKEKIEDHPIVFCFILMVSTAGGTWVVAEKLRIDGLNEELSARRYDIDRLEEKLRGREADIRARQAEVGDLTKSVAQLNQKIIELEEKYGAKDEASEGLDPRSRLEYSFWVYYGRLQADGFVKQNLMVNQVGQTNRLPRVGDTAESLLDIPARSKPLSGASMLGQICLRDQFRVEEVKQIGASHIWVRGFGRIWPGSIKCPVGVGKPDNS